MSAPIFRDPIQDGAADPTVIRNEESGEWWMFYTNRQPAAEGGKRWIHGSPIGVAVSADQGANWRYRGTVAGLDDPADLGPNTHWAPEVIRHSALYHMFLTYISGVPDSTTAHHPRRIVHLTSPDLETWTRHGALPLSSACVIDACVYACPDGLWRLWYKDEADGSSTWSAASADLFEWTVEERVLPGLPNHAPHEGPNVFRLAGWYWLIVDEWRGQAVYRSQDCRDWKRQGLIGSEGGRDGADHRYVRHADVVVTAENQATLYYFTHPEWDEASQATGPQSPAERTTAIHHGLLSVEDDTLLFDRDVEIHLALLSVEAART